MDHKAAADLAEQQPGHHDRAGQRHHLAVDYQPAVADGAPAAATTSDSAAGSERDGPTVTATNTAITTDAGIERLGPSADFPERQPQLYAAAAELARSRRCLVGKPRD